MRLPLLLMTLLAVPALLAACARPRGGSSGGSGGDDDDDVSGPISLAESYAHELTIDIAPTDLGTQIGVIECTTTLTGTVTRDPDDTGCDACLGAWTGSIDGTQSDCNEFQPEPSFRYGFEVRGDTTWLWTQDDTGGWSEAGPLGFSGGALVADWTSEMGELELLMATAAHTAAFE